MNRRAPRKLNPVRIESIQNYQHMRVMSGQDYLKYFHHPFVAVWFLYQGNYVLAKHNRESDLPQVVKDEKGNKFIEFTPDYSYPQYPARPIRIRIELECLVNTGARFHRERDTIEKLQQRILELELKLHLND